jgi:hypothetical protein
MLYAIWPAEIKGEDSRQVVLLQKSGDAVTSPLPIAVTAVFGDEGQIFSGIAAPLVLLCR